jgi:deazaflavin-dependent oxidoreductase (nitroreductase family)
MYRVGNAIHLAIYPRSEGRVAGSIMGGRLLLLTTTGRKSSKERTVPLLFMEQGDEMMIIGSNSGRATDPSWVFNLRTNPEATVQIGAESRPVRARFADGQEWERLWAELISQYPRYATYKDKTARRIPLVLLTPE